MLHTMLGGQGGRGNSTYMSGVVGGADVEGSVQLHLSHSQFLTTPRCEVGRGSGGEWDRRGLGLAATGRSMH